MLTRSDITILMQQVDVTKAYDLLCLVRNLPPGSQRPAVYIQGRGLGGGSRIPAVGALPVVALPVPVIEGHLAHGAVGVRDED